MKLSFSSAPTPREAAAGADIVFACVGNDDDLRAVTLGPDGAFAGMRPGAIFVDHTTASAEVARQLHREALARGLHFIDAPVSGGQAGAVNGALTVMCGGDEAPFAAMQPVALSFARAVTRVGPSGSGQLAKMVNQVAIVGMVQALAEALAFGKRAGLDMPLVLDVIGKGAAQSWQMDNRGKTMLEERFDFGFVLYAKMTHGDFPVSRLIQNPSLVHVLGCLKQRLRQPGRLFVFGRHITSCKISSLIACSRRSSFASSQAAAISLNVASSSSPMFSRSFFAKP